MAAGIFDPSALPEGWFDETADPAGWFDAGLVAAATGGAPPQLPPAGIIESPTPVDSYAGLDIDFSVPFGLGESCRAIVVIQDSASAITITLGGQSLNLDAYYLIPGGGAVAFYSLDDIQGSPNPARVSVSVSPATGVSARAARCDRMGELAYAPASWRETDSGSATAHSYNVPTEKYGEFVWGYFVNASAIECTATGTGDSNVAHVSPPDSAYYVDRQTTDAGDNPLTWSLDGFPIEVAGVAVSYRSPAQYFTDMAADTVGGSPTGEWVPRGSISGGFAKSGGDVVFDTVDFAQHFDFLSYEPVGVVKGDVEALSLFRFTNDAYPGGLALAIDPTAETAYGFWFYAPDSVVLAVSAIIGGVDTVLAVVDFDSVVDTDYWIRAQISGSSLRMRVWADGGAEPGTWNVEVSAGSPNLPSGYVGLFARNWPGTRTWKQFGVGTYGAEAPASEPASGGDTALVVQDSTHAHTADNLALTQANTVAVQDSTHAHTVDSPTLTQANTLAVQDSTHAHTADNLELVQANTLAVAHASHAHTADNLALVQANTLAVADASHAHTADNVTLETGATLETADALHAHTADNLALTQANTIAVQDSTHGHTVDNLELVQANTLTVADALHAHTVDSPTLTQANTLSVADALHAHTADNLALTQANTLAVQDSTHAHTAESPTLGTADTLSVADALHGHTADNLDLTQANTLAVADALHAHTADNVVLSQGLTLAPADALHGHTADNVALTQANTLAVQDSTHAHFADLLELEVGAILVPADALHGHTADNLELVQANTLAVADALHAHFADGVTLDIPGDAVDPSLLDLVTPADRLYFVPPGVRCYIVRAGRRLFD